MSCSGYYYSRQNKMATVRRPGFISIADVRGLCTHRSLGFFTYDLICFSWFKMFWDLANLTFCAQSNYIGVESASGVRSTEYQDIDTDHVRFTILGNYVGMSGGLRRLICFQS